MVEISQLHLTDDLGIIAAAQSFLFCLRNVKAMKIDL